MVIGIDNSPLVSTHKLAHKIRGTGFYIKNLISALETYYPENKYITFTQGGKIFQKVDILHFPYFEPFFLSLPFRKTGKTIITIHDLTPLVYPKLFPVGVKGKIKYRIQKYIARYADAIITDSESSKKDIQKLLHISPDKVFSVPLAAGEQFKCIEISKKRQKELRDKYLLPEKFALYVGDATPNKNLRVLVDAVSMSNVPLVMVGGALAKEDMDLSHPWNVDVVYVKSAAEKNMNIKILGFVPDEELVELYNMARLFVFPSMYEGFGLPLLEAAACGCPIVTTKGGSIPEVIGDACIYADPSDAQDMAKKIKQLYVDDSLHNEYAKKGVAQAAKFSWKKTAQSTMQVYEKVFNKT